MTFQVPYLSDAAIEAQATDLVKSFEAKHGTIQTPETPLDELIENHLGLGFEIVDLGHPAILGQLDIGQNLIRINTTLDPYTTPHLRGRYNFTLAHEVGHQVLHRPYVEALMAEDVYSEEEAILCRTDEKAAPIEVQADKFAACLLMPADKLHKAFVEATRRPYGCNAKELTIGARKAPQVMDFLFPNRGSYQPTDEEILWRWFRSLADIFHVSHQAMVIRLQRVGLLYGLDS